MKKQWPFFITHLLAFAIGWTLMRSGGADDPSSEDSVSIKNPANGNPRQAGEKSDNPWLQATPADYRAAWDELLRKPRSFGAPNSVWTADSALAEMDFLRMWARVDTAAALKGLGDLRPNPTTFVVLDDFITECGPGNPEPFFKQVPGMQNLPIMRTVPLLARLSAKVAADDPQRACALIHSMPAGEMRAMVLTKMLGSLDDRAFQAVADRIRSHESDGKSHTEVTMVDAALDKQIERRKKQVVR